MTIETLNLDKGMCIFELKPTCEKRDGLTQKRNWTLMDGYQYKSNDPDLNIIMKHYSVFFFGFGSHRFEAGLRRIGLHEVEIVGSNVHIFVLGFLSLSCRLVAVKFWLQSHVGQLIHTVEAFQLYAHHVFTMVGK